jgi:L-malate glycosyltransferase
VQIPKSIHQILPNLSHGDAIGNLVVNLQNLLREWGYHSEIYVQTVDKTLQNKVHHVHEFDTSLNSNNIIIYHFSIGSGLAEFLKNLKCKKIIINHNITPPEYMKGLNDLAEHWINVGIDELKKIVKFSDLVLCDSEFNRQQVLKMGCKKAETFPIFVDFKKLNSYSLSLSKVLQDGNINILHVGRIVTNKRIENIIKVFYYYNKQYNDKSKLFIVGQYEGMGVEGYLQRLLALKAELSLDNIYFPGKVPQFELNTYYKNSNVFLSMSEHEGFCVPLIESLYFGLPILAFNTSAIPYTLDGAGILINEKKYLEIAGMIHTLVSDTEFRNKIIASQEKRLKEYVNFNFKNAIKNHIKRLMND